MLPLTKPTMTFNQDHKEADEENNLHDQLPSVEEIRVASHRSLPRSNGPISSARCRVGRCGEISIISLVAILIAAVIGLSVGISKRGDELAAASAGATASGGGNATPALPDLEPREEFVRQWLLENNVSSAEDMDLPGSAHEFARLWIADEDQLQLPIPDSIDSPQGARFVSRYVIALMYLALDGSNWEYQLSFLSEKDVCEWNDIFVAAEGVQGRFFRIGIACNGGVLNTWQMPGMNLQGTIPTEIALLSDLRVIALNSNKIGGTLPEGFQKMTALDYVALQKNNFVGSIPAWLGDLQSIRVLGLGDNDFDGQIPTALGKLTDIITLGLDNNKLSGGISQLAPLTMLKRLYIEGNEFDSNLGDTFSGMIELEELDASNNRFTGTIPDYLLSSSTLRVLDLHGNELDGSIPSDIPLNGALKYLALHENLLQGSIPSNITSMYNLTHLDLSSNVFGGEIPAGLGELSELQYLFLAANEFTPGSIPSWIGNLTKLVDLSLRETGRLGDVPSEIGQLKNLTMLDLHDNSLTGPLPRQLGELPNLRFLILSRNSLTGTIPTDFELLTSLEMIMLNDNSFTGSADGICADGVAPTVFVADCGGEELTCECCTKCCVDTDEECSDIESIGNLDPIWENSFEREFYEFGSDLIFDGR